MTAAARPVPVGEFTSNPHGLTQHEVPVKLIDPVTGIQVGQDPKYQAPYVEVSFVDWHGRLAVVRMPHAFTLDEQCDLLERAMRVHGPDSREACCEAQRRDRGGQPFTSSPITPDPFGSIERRYAAFVTQLAQSEAVT